MYCIYNSRYDMCFFQSDTSTFGLLSPIFDNNFFSNKNLVGRLGLQRDQSLKFPLDWKRQKKQKNVKKVPNKFYATPIFKNKNFGVIQKSTTVLFIIEFSVNDKW